MTKLVPYLDLRVDLHTFNEILKEITIKYKYVYEKTCIDNNINPWANTEGETIPLYRAIKYLTIDESTRLIDYMKSTLCKK